MTGVTGVQHISLIALSLQLLCLWHDSRIGIVGIVNMSRVVHFCGQMLLLFHSRNVIQSMRNMELI